MKKISIITSIFCILVSVAYAGDQIDLKGQIIAEPKLENDDVQTCEMAGPGFKFIPGTQTCIRISGHVQYEINVKNK